MVHAVIVTFNPDISLLNAAIDSIINQVQHVLVVDNGSSFDINQQVNSHEKLRIIKNGINVGIAAAQNIGINISLSSNADYILISDQDSLFPPNYINILKNSFAEHLDDLTCCVGPRFLDVNKKHVDGIIVPSTFFKRKYPDHGLIEVMQMIASGKLIRADFLRKIGLMDEELFIDWVDLEWCWRARFLGYKLFTNCDVFISHQLGDKSVNLKFREVNLRSPIRHYYITRNAFYLAIHSKFLPFPNKVVLLFRSFRYVFAFPILSVPRLRNLKAVIFGFFDGISASLGPCKRNF
jgi:rhamnosyltransferase